MNNSYISFGIRLEHFAGTTVASVEVEPGEPLTTVELPAGTTREQAITYFLSKLNHED